MLFLFVDGSNILKVSYCFEVTHSKPQPSGVGSAAGLDDDAAASPPSLWPRSEATRHSSTPMDRRRESEAKAESALVSRRTLVGRLPAEKSAWHSTLECLLRK